ncbi:threonine--tRNA ligase [Ferrovibrio sp.]|uniref:threonine--tRNA ligase n=1 Tax=Ferrovibrio sp. TaxID=1917215 RepID=UPI003518FBE1
MNSLDPELRPDRLQAPDAYDHRVLGTRLDLFHQQEEGPGMVFWHPRGFAIYRVVEDYIRRRMREAGFMEVRTPQLLSWAFWEQSGHAEKFANEMFRVSSGNRPFALKPMSCPGQIQLFRKRVRSVHDLPLRYFEFGAVHRDEPSGALQGLMRARSFTQDDVHIFCTEEQVEEEVQRFCELLRDIYSDFGFGAPQVFFSTRPAKRAGDDATWDRAEAALVIAARKAGLDFAIRNGEGAFYGPKLEFHLRDSHGRAWQCGTAQLDFVLPERLDASYVGSDSRRHRPVLIHHAVLGSLERFIGMLLEHHRGTLPLWLAPEQVMVASIGREQEGYVRKAAAVLGREGLRVATDIRRDRLSRKIAEAREQGVPVLAVAGEREMERGTLSLRWRDGRQEEMALAEIGRRLRGQAVK